MSALPKGDTGTTAENESGRRQGFPLLETTFTLFVAFQH